VHVGRGKDCVVWSMSKSVGVRMQDGSEWGFRPLAGVERMGGVQFSGGLGGVEIVWRIGWSVAYCWGVGATNAHI
jgi:hypothetical protein